MITVEMLKPLLIAIVFIIVISLILRRVTRIHSKPVVDKKVAELKTLYRRENVFLCENLELVNENLHQFYGQVLNTALRPGMKIEIGGSYVSIKEVYDNDDTPAEPDPLIPPGVEGVTIVTESISDSDYKVIYERLKKEVVIPFKLQ